MDVGFKDLLFQRVCMQVLQVTQNGHGFRRLTLLTGVCVRAETGILKSSSNREGGVAVTHEA